MRSHQESNPSSNWLDAGRSLRVPKSTLSHRLQELEKSLGVRLLNRTSRRFGMTEAGGEFYRHSVAMLREAERAETAMRHRLHEATGTVRCTASLATMQFAISEVLSSFLVQYPKVNVVAHATRFPARRSLPRGEARSG